MAVTLIINPGSSSKKYTLFDSGRIVGSFRYEKNADVAEVVVTTTSRKQYPNEKISSKVYQIALVDMLRRAVSLRILQSASTITTIGIRIVAPGKFFQTHHMITSDFVSYMRSKKNSAPLHIPAILSEIEQCNIELPKIPLIGVSDSAFHSSISPLSKSYSIPRFDREHYEVERYGYHGISVSSVVREIPTMIENKQKIIIAHVGSGISLTAIHNNQSVATTMGYSPLSGMIMGTRAGDVDPGALLELMRAKKMNVSETYTYLSTEGGLRAICGYADIRTILHRAACGDTDCVDALQKLKNNFQKKLLGLMADIQGCEVIIFTGTAAERNGELRALLLSGLEWIGIDVHSNKNDEIVGGKGVISKEGSKIVVLVMHSNEDAEMLRIVQTFL
jgi:acetate kinase